MFWLTDCLKCNCEAKNLPNLTTLDSGSCCSCCPNFLFNFPTKFTTFLLPWSVFTGFETLSVDWNGLFWSFQSCSRGLVTNLLQVPVCFCLHFPRQIPQKWVPTKRHQIPNMQRIVGTYSLLFIFFLTSFLPHCQNNDLGFNLWIRIVEKAKTHMDVKWRGKLSKQWKERTQETEHLLHTLKELTTRHRVHFSAVFSQKSPQAVIKYENISLSKEKPDVWDEYMCVV